ncbi:MAG: aspartate ammonia-lyase [Planctomycetota bacterium]
MRHQAGPEARSYSTGQKRREKDMIGELDVPHEAYYGVQTARALANFEITGVPISRYGQLIVALAMVKIAAAKANFDCGAMDEDRAKAITKAGFEIVRGRLHDHFPVDLLQGGAGTSTNMNANEVIANRALEFLGKSKGEYEFCHPNNDVNRSQSTNDVYPTALKIAMATSGNRLVETLRLLVSAFEAKGKEFAAIIKMGRTQLQDAVPMTLGQEFRAFAVSLEQEIKTLQSSTRLLYSINMGGTAIGTGLNAPKGYARKVVEHLAAVSKLDLALAEDLIESTQSTQSFVMFSSALKSLAIKVSKIASDLRLLSSGPRAGLNEINLPAKQPGSSIMPGKVNPVIPEVVNQVAYRVIGNDLSVTMAAEAGQLQLNVMEPVIAASILDSVAILQNAVQTFRVNCVEGIVANADICRSYVENGIGLVTALVPVLGYPASSKLAKEALSSGRGIVELVREQGLLKEDQIAALLAPENMAGNASPGATKGS